MKGQVKFRRGPDDVAALVTSCKVALKRIGGRDAAFDPHRDNLRMRGKCEREGENRKNAFYYARHYLSFSHFAQMLVAGEKGERNGVCHGSVTGRGGMKMIAAIERGQ